MGSCFSSAKKNGTTERSQITLTVYRPAQNGVDEDALQVQVSRTADVAGLKRALEALYGLPWQRQVLRRKADGPPLEDTHPLQCSDGDVLYLRMEVLSPLAQAMAGAVAEVTQLSESLHESLHQVVFRIVFVMVESGGRPERRCELELVATARISEVLDSVQRELQAEDEGPLGLEYAGEPLPMGGTLHALGLANGDTVLVRRLGGSKSSNPSEVHAPPVAVVSAAC